MATKPPRKSAPRAEPSAEFITVDEAAELLRVNRHTLYGAIKSDSPPWARQIGRVLRINRATLYRWFEQGELAVVPKKRARLDLPASVRRLAWEDSELHAILRLLAGELRSQRATHEDLASSARRLADAVERLASSAVREPERAPKVPHQRSTRTPRRSSPTRTPEGDLASEMQRAVDLLVTTPTRPRR